jgi:hypothetical protein
MRLNALSLVVPAALIGLFSAGAVEAHTPADRMAVVAAVDEIGLAADLREWAAVRQQFADRVYVDYSALTGTPGAEVNADALVAGWKAFLPGFTSTQHVITNHRVAINGRRAQVTSQFIATHRLDGAAGGELWTVAGRYLHTLERHPSGWKVTAMTLTVAWQSGNTELPKLAAAVAAKAER